MNLMRKLIYTLAVCILAACTTKTEKTYLSLVPPCHMTDKIELDIRVGAASTRSSPQARTAASSMRRSSLSLLPTRGQQNSSKEHGYSLCNKPQEGLLICEFYNSIFVCSCSLPC